MGKGSGIKIETLALRHQDREYIREERLEKSSKCGAHSAGADTGPGLMPVLGVKNLVEEF